MIITLESKTPTRGITYEVDGKSKTLFGGSFFEAPDQGYLTINLMKEIALPCDIHVPIVDFSVPENTKEMIDAFDKIIAYEGDAFVGCFGGKGRTGLFMACFLKYLGYFDVICQVREEYNEHAVENFRQMEFVWDFETVRQDLNKADTPEVANCEAVNPEAVNPEVAKTSKFF